MSDAKLQTIVSGQLWEVPHLIRMLAGVYLPTRMVVIRVDATRLALHSPVPLTDALAAEIDALGAVSVLIAPNNFHHLYLRPAMERWPDAEVWAAPGLPEKRRNLTLENLLGPGAAPPWSDALKPIFMRGASKVDETVFLHRATRTLIVTDVLFNLRKPPGALSPIMFRLMGTWNRTFQSRLWRAVVKERAEMAQSTREALDQDFDRLIMAHGEIIETGGKQAFRDAASWLLK